MQQGVLSRQFPQRSEKALHILDKGYQGAKGCGTGEYAAAATPENSGDGQGAEGFQGTEQEGVPMNGPKGGLPVALLQGAEFFQGALLLTEQLYFVNTGQAFGQITVKIRHPGPHLAHGAAHAATKQP